MVSLHDDTIKADTNMRRHLNANSSFSATDIQNHRLCAKQLETCIHLCLQFELICMWVYRRHEVARITLAFFHISRLSQSSFSSACIQQGISVSQVDWHINSVCSTCHNKLLAGCCSSTIFLIFSLLHSLSFSDLPTHTHTHTHAPTGKITIGWFPLWSGLVATPRSTSRYNVSEPPW